MTITMKIIINTLLLVLVAFVAGGYSVYSSLSNKRNMDILDKTFVPAVNMSSELSISSLTAINSVLAALNTWSEGNYNKAVEDISSTYASLTKLKEHLAKTGTDESLTEINSLVERYTNVLEEYKISAYASMRLKSKIIENGHSFNAQVDKLLTAANDEAYMHYMEHIQSSAYKIKPEELLADVDVLDKTGTIVDNIHLILNSYNSAIQTQNFDELRNLDEQMNEISSLVFKLQKNAVEEDELLLFDNVADEFIKVVPLFQQTVSDFSAFAENSADREKKREALKAVNNELIHTALAKISTLADGMLNSLQFSLKYSIVILVISFIIGVIIIILMLLAITRPIQHMVTLVNELNSGDGDLTKRIKIKGHNELTDLAYGFNHFIENVSGIVMEVKRSADSVNSGNGKLATAMSQMSGTFRKQGEDLGGIVSSIDDVLHVALEAEAKLKNAVEALNRTTENTSEGMRMLENLRTDIGAINTQSLSLAASIQSLEEKSKKIDDIINVINSIADQTNLLALNAAIEAARAGDAGRGFAVVADEVRKLAENTQKATGEIDHIIRDLQQESETASIEMRKSAETVSQGIARIDSALSGFKTAADSMDDTNTQIISVTAIIHQQNDSIKTVEDNAQSISSGVEQSGSAVSEMENIVNDLRSQSENMHKLVGKFKTS